MCEAFEDVTSMPGLWSNYEKEAHPHFGLAPDGGAAATPLTTTVPQDQAGYLVIANISKKDNVKRLISLAVAYGVEHVLIVGQPHFELATHAPLPAHVPGLLARVQLHRFDDLAACQAFLRARNARLYGVEIVDGATSVEAARFAGHGCAFMMGNEGSGMNGPQLAACDEFLVIPQFGNGTASLNVSNAAAIVLEHFALARAGTSLGSTR